MHKVIKILLKLISTAILLLIFIPLILSILLTMPSIQSRLITYATTFASEFLDSKVSIGKLSAGALGRLTINDLYLEDINRDTLLYAQRMDLNILKIGFSSREVALGSCKVSNGVVNLRQDADSIMNIKHIIDKLTPETPAPKAVVISFSSLEIDNLDINIDLLTHREPSYGVDFGYMQMQNIEAEITDFTIDGPAIHATIKEFSCVENSGFDVMNLSGKLYVSVGVVSMLDATLDSRYSHLNMPYVSVVGASWANYKNFIEMVDVSGRVENSIISSDDVAYFAPRLRDWGVTLSSLNGSFDGEVNDLVVDIEEAILDEGSAVAAQLQISSLPDIANTRFDVQLKELIATPNDILKLSEVFTGKALSNEVARTLNKLKELRCNGDFEGTLSNFSSSFVASTAMGDVNSSFSMTTRKADNKGVIEGEVTIKGMELGKLLNTSEIGSINLTSTIKGEPSNIYSSSFAHGIISYVKLRGESYHNISYGGTIENGDLFGRVISQNIGFDFDAIANIDLLDKQGKGDLDVHLYDIDLKTLKINKRDSISRLSTHVSAQYNGDSIDQISGQVTIGEGEYRYNADTLRGGGIILRVDNNPNLKSFEVESDYADISYSSADSYAQSWSYLRDVMRDYIPSLYAKSANLKNPADPIDPADPTDPTDPTDPEPHTPPTNYSHLKITINDSAPLIDAITNNLQIAKDSEVELMYNSSQKDISLAIKSPYVEFNSILAIDVDMGATNLRGTYLNEQLASDSLAVYGSSKEFLVGTRQFDNLSFSGGAVDDRVSLNAGYNDSDNLSSATVSASGAVHIDPLRGRMARIYIEPSQFIQGSQMWSIGAKSIEIDKAGILIDNFLIRNDDQELRVNGLASRSTNDTLQVKMQHFDLSILSSITEAIGYNVNGVTNGDVAVSSALYNMRVDANVLLDSVSVNELPAPPMNVRAEWDTKMNQARVSLTNRIKGDTLIRGYFIPSAVKYYGQLDVDSLHMGLLNAPLKGIISETTGYADAHITINGERRNAVVEGYVDVVDVETKVDYTNVNYRLPKARILLENNELSCQNAEILDPLDNRGAMTLRVNLQQLTNIAYRVRLNVTDFMALNTTVKDNDLFYGKMFASGVVALEGNKMGVNMDITATTCEDSEFFMPLLGKSDISSAEFITFVSAQEQVDTTGISQVKRRFFESDRRKRGVAESNLNINMALNVTPDAEFQLVIDPTVGDIIKGRGEGRINLRVNPKSNIFDMYGDYSITEGSYLFTLRNIINKRFVINPGSTIQWSGDPVDAQLNIEAVYKLKTSLQPIMSDESTRSVPVDCTIKLTDRLMQPEVSFDISLPTGDAEQQAVLANLLNDQETISRQFFYLMLANSFISESATGATTDIGVSTTAATGFELLTNQLSNWLSSSNYNVIIRYRPESDITGDELDFGISRSLINNRLLVEVEGNYTNNDISSSGESEEDAMSNFAGEAYITWLIDRSGALKLRGFTQTIDTYDENQGLQETGVGIYYKESFDNFKDLKARVKARFSRRGVALRNKDREEEDSQKDDDEQENDEQAWYKYKEDEDKEE